MEGQQRCRKRSEQSSRVDRAYLTATNRGRNALTVVELIHSGWALRRASLAAYSAGSTPASLAAKSALDLAAAVAQHASCVARSGAGSGVAAGSLVRGLRP